MIKVEINKLILDELIKIHMICDKDFDPILSTRVVIEDYCQKLYVSSIVFSAYWNINLAGILAMYCNDEINNTGYISSVCIYKEYRGLKIGKSLMESAIKYAQAEGMLKIKLEVGIKNLSAIKLYRKYGFIISETNQDIHSMELTIDK